MKLGVLTVLFGDRPLDKTLEYLKSIGIEALEVGAGGYPGKAHCNPEVLLSDKKALDTFKGTIEEYGMPINAFACHGNPVHPNKKTAETFRNDFRNAVLLAEKLGIEKIVGFSGCPGDSENAKYSNWVTCPWPEDFSLILKYQWNEVLIPFWKKEAEFCLAHGVKKVAFEMHPGFCVYNPDSLLRLRETVGDVIGANFDPSHLIWQGIDPVAAIRKLGKAIYHFHAKDTKIDKYNTAISGVLDNKHYGDELNRSWVFRTVGYGNDMQYWRDMISNLKLIGYDDILSIEHEDSLMTNTEGIEKAVDFLNKAMIKGDKPTGMFWA
ncbi:MAG: xylose isomerase [Clostridiales bacterium GWF2_36_10]|nr:MAG: xylose isomerase [Clostridiales bacterium GWF2_36_10]HAN21735.1 xylose isomerase [Clostridiales bacterium]